MNLDDAPVILKYVRDLLQEARNEYRSLLALEKAIAAANPGAEEEQQKRRIERRKLEALLQGEDVALTFQQLSGLQSFFARRGHALGRIFRPSPCLTAIAERGSVAFLIGSRPLQLPSGRALSVISRHDLVAMAHLQRAISQIDHAVYFDVQDVFLADEIGPESIASEEKEPWHALLEDRSWPSVISLASPRTCQATELMLAKMFGVAPLGRSRLVSRGRAPDPDPSFQFLWSPGQKAADYPSSFSQVMTPGERVRLAREQASIKGGPEFLAALSESDGEASAIAVSDEIYWTQRKGQREWTDYAILVAQQRPHRQVWLVAAGLSGPATTGAAQCAAALPTDLPPWPQVLIAIVKVSVERRSDRRGDDRELTRSDIHRVMDPWSPPTPSS